MLLSKISMEAEEDEVVNSHHSIPGLAELGAMGFGAEVSTHALRLHSGDVATAAIWLADWLPTADAQEWMSARQERLAARLSHRPHRR